MSLRYTIGIIELASIFKGYEVQDQILKSALVEKIIARTICSGKYLIIVKGEISDVETSLAMARETGAFAIVNATLVPNVDEKIFPAIIGSTTLDSKEVDGLAVIETFSVAAAIRAADLAVKEAEIEILRIHVAMAIGGKGLVVLTGNIDALKSALIPAIDYLQEEGMLAGHTLITQPHEDVLRDLL
ncbi:MAG: BMC domain-containing protein [Calditrichaeota bacterium]|nr:BMC domain-containing protein [Calditrichota bacterium]